MVPITIKSTFSLVAKNPKTMSYYDNKTIPYYWDLAKHYVLADNFYSVLSYSLPNHWYAVAGQAPATSVFYAMHRPPNNDILKQQENASSIAGGNPNSTSSNFGVNPNPNSTSSNFGVNPNPNTSNSRDEVARLYLEKSNLTRTVADLFVNNTQNITWKYYDHLVQEGGYKARCN